MRRLTVSAIIVLIAFHATCGLAATQTETTTPFFKMAQWFKQGGFLMYPIVLCSLLSLAILFERLFALRRSNVVPTGFLDELQKLREQGDIKGILTLCLQSDSSLSRILEAGFRRFDYGLLETERAIEGAGQHEVAQLTSHLRLLGAIAAITPMIGLLGTVTGMIRAFENIAQSGTGNPNLMASGIAEALTTTAAGMMVAIPSLAAYHFIRGRVDRLVYEIEEIATRLLASLPGRMPAAKKE
ncbi:MAG: MotA/TolQ/ExbB proton channel family protein [Pseudomonadota bacterium]